MSRPSKTTRPAVGVNRPVTLLKSVVLPAPFGPMSANTSPRLMCRLTLSTATSPPKRLVRLVSSRMFSVLSGTRSLLDRRCFLQDRRMLELLLAHATRQQTLRPQQHHAHEDAAVDDEVQALRLFAEARPVATALVQRSKSDAARERGGILRQPGDQVEDEHGESDGVGTETERRHYLEVAVAGPGTLDPCRQQGLVDEADGVDAACPLVEVVEELGHDLPKSEGDDGEVVTS